MRRFAELLERLAFTPARNGKLRLLTGYLAEAPDPDRGWGLAAITRDLRLDAVKPAMLRALTVERVDAELFALSYDFVGDLAETIALIWPAPERTPDDPGLGEVVDAAAGRLAPRGAAGDRAAARPPGRVGALRAAEAGDRRPARRRLGPSRQAGAGGLRRPGRRRDRGAVARAGAAVRGALRLAGRARAEAGAGRRGAVPAGDAVASASRRAISTGSTRQTSRPSGSGTASGCRPRRTGGAGGSTRAPATTSRAAFPDLVEALDFDAALDGELLVRRAEGEIAPFADLQQRLNRKTVTPAHLAACPAHFRAYDLLQDGRARPAAPALRRAARARSRPSSRGSIPRASTSRRCCRSPSWDELAALRAAPPDPVDRGGDAEAAGQPVRAGAAEGAVVEVEARPAHGRRGADVRPARPRQALGLLLGLHLRALDRGRASWCRSARPTSASPTRS